MSIPTPTYAHNFIYMFSSFNTRYTTTNIHVTPNICIYGCKHAYNHNLEVPLYSTFAKFTRCQSPLPVVAPFPSPSHA